MRCPAGPAGRPRRRSCSGRPSPSAGADRGPLCRSVLTSTLGPLWRWLGDERRRRQKPTETVPARRGGYVPYPLVTMDVTRLAPLRSGLYADHATVQVVGLKTSFG